MNINKQARLLTARHRERQHNRDRQISALIQSRHNGMSHKAEDNESLN
ncbi:hypothetical protein PN462_04410 [Spirulina sp. CS-785/01]|nr:hypothetical protein [Spirulina sp. CS-785/01]MDB9312337.1 hypothetical protein [Spirulina sp. CS-785/01]